MKRKFTYEAENAPKVDSVAFLIIPLLGEGVMVQGIFFFSRFITIYPTTSNSSIDLRTLRAVRVLRPLKLVSGIPSMYESIFYEYIPFSKIYFAFL